MTVLLIAALHSLPVILAGWWLEKNALVILVAMIMVVVAFSFGNSAYVLADLIGIGVGVVLGWEGNKAREKEKKAVEAYAQKSGIRNKLEEIGGFIIFLVVIAAVGRFAVNFAFDLWGGSEKQKDNPVSNQNDQQKSEGYVSRDDIRNELEKAKLDATRSCLGGKFHDLFSNLGINFSNEQYSEYCRCVEDTTFSAYNLEEMITAEKESKSSDKIIYQLVRRNSYSCIDKILHPESQRGAPQINATPRTIENQKKLKASCIYKPVMTDEDYRACGLRPPALPRK